MYIYIYIENISAPDTTKFLVSIKTTDLFGTISLLHSTIVPVGKCVN